MKGGVKAYSELTEQVRTSARQRLSPPVGRLVTTEASWPIADAGCGGSTCRWHRGRVPQRRFSPCRCECSGRRRCKIAFVQTSRLSRDAGLGVHERERA
jgi:hypothetical protein